MRTFIGKIRIGRIHRRFAGIVIELALTLEVVFWRVILSYKLMAQAQYAGNVS
jgi:hypothetical protein